MHDVIDHDQRRASKSVACEQAIFQLLANGPLPSKELRARAMTMAKASERTYDSARTRCKVQNGVNPQSKEHWSKLPGQEFAWKSKTKAKRRRHSR